MEISQINRGMSNFFKVDNLDGIGEHMAYEIGMLENNTLFICVLQEPFYRKNIFQRLTLIRVHSIAEFKGFVKY